jgi:hypothetical protein
MERQNDERPGRFAAVIREITLDAVRAVVAASSSVLRYEVGLEPAQCAYLAGRIMSEARLRFAVNAAATLATLE